jgi:hypothetical protein
MAGITSAEARQRVRIAQFAGLGIGVMALALWAMDLPWLSSSLPDKPPVREATGDTPAPTILQVVRIDAEAPRGIAERLDLAANRPAAPAPTGAEAPAAATTAQPNETPWEYLGAIEEPGRLLALVSVKGRQKIVGAGTHLKVTTPAAEGRPESVEHAATVTEIKREHIVIEEDGGARRTIPLKTKATSVAWVKNMPTPIQGTQGGTLASAAMSAEARQRLIAQGIDPSQAERARLAALSAARGRNGGDQPAAMAAGAIAPGKMTEAQIKNARSKAVPISDADAHEAGLTPPPAPQDSPVSEDARQGNSGTVN